jgi:hypothetical protein
MMGAHAAELLQASVDSLKYLSGGSQQNDLV